MHYARLSPILLAVLALACPAQPAPAPSTSASTSAEPTGRRVDDRRPDEPFTVQAFGRPVELGGSWEYTDERRRNFDLDRADASDRRVREHEIKLDARVRLGSDSEAFVELVGLHETRRTQRDGREVRHSLERGQMWWQKERLGGTPWALQVGRVALLDRRAWWWDEDLDAVRLRYHGSGVRLDTGLAREVARVSSAQSGIAPDAKGVTRWFGQATWPYAERHAIDAFWLVQRDGSGAPRTGARFTSEDDTDPSDLRARWLGLRASGEWRGSGGARLGYWADTAWLSGRERLTAFDEQPDDSLLAGATTQQRVRGHAFDVGTTAIAPLPLRPSLTVGYARGSEGFRSTGLHENKTRFAGVKRWQRYGELVRPELSNLSVTTLGTGVRLTDDTSLELVQHRLRQRKPSSTLAGSRLSADPEGTNRSIGRETALLLAVRESKRVEFVLKASHFKPGAAFAPERRDSARAIEFGVTVNF